MNKLYILPFDHRGSFIKMFGYDEKNLSPEDITSLSDYKHVIYEGFLRALEMGVPKEPAAILVDEQFGKKIHEEAKTKGITRILTIEKSGQDEFDLEYGDAFKEHIDALSPRYVKVLVRYNPMSDSAMNERQRARLKTVNDFCKEGGYKFLFELLAIPTPQELETAGDDKEKYEQGTRWEVMRKSIKEFYESGIEPEIWKIEGLESMEQMKAVVNETRSGGRSKVGVVVLGRGESDEKVRVWLSTAAKIEGVIGFAVGRTVFKESLTRMKSGALSREEAVLQIAKNYKSYADLFESAKK